MGRPTCWLDHLLPGRWAEPELRHAGGVIGEVKQGRKLVAEDSVKLKG